MSKSVDKANLEKNLKMYHNSITKPSILKYAKDGIYKSSTKKISVNAESSNGIEIPVGVSKIYVDDDETFTEIPSEIEEESRNISLEGTSYTGLATGTRKLYTNANRDAGKVVYYYLEDVPMTIEEALDNVSMETATDEEIKNLFK